MPKMRLTSPLSFILKFVVELFLQSCDELGVLPHDQDVVDVQRHDDEGVAASVYVYARVGLRGLESNHHKHFVYGVVP